MGGGTSKYKFELETLYTFYLNENTNEKFVVDLPLFQLQMLNRSEKNGYTLVSFYNPSNIEWKDAIVNTKDYTCAILGYEGDDIKYITLRNTKNEFIVFNQPKLIITKNGRSVTGNITVMNSLHLQLGTKQYL